jgi:hypothetical protein
MLGVHNSNALDISKLVCRAKTIAAGDLSRYADFILGRDSDLKLTDKL